MNEDPNIAPTPESTPRPQATNRGLMGAAIVLFCATITSLGYVAREAEYARQVATRNDQLNAALNQTRTQVDMLAAKLSAAGRVSGRGFGRASSGGHRAKAR